MNTEANQSSSGASPHPPSSTLFDPLRDALRDADEAQRYRLLASFLVELADKGPTEDNGRRGQSSDQLALLGKKFQAAEKAKAALEDTLRTTQAEFAHREKQLQAEQERAKDLQKVIDDQRARLKALESELGDVEAQLVAKNAEIHQVEVKHEQRLLKLQRAELASIDQGKVDQLEKSRIDLSKELEDMRTRLEQLRKDKDDELAKLKESLQESRAGASEGPDQLLAALWQRLAKAKPALSDDAIPPNIQAGERLVDAFIELVRFVDEFDKSMRVFLSRYTKYHPSVKVPWEAYAKGDDLVEFVRRTVAPQGSRPVGPLKMRLRLLYSWMYAAMVGCDSAIESIGSELQAHMMGPVGTAKDPNRTLRDYLRDDGHLLFMQYVCEQRSLRLAETYGRG